MLNQNEQLICFAVVCRVGSITAAANFLGCSKAHVSRKLAELEHFAQAQLILRTTRRLHLTETGKQLLAESQPLLLQAEKSQRLLRNLEQKLTGIFRITAPVSFCTYLLAPVFSLLTSAFPEMTFELFPTNENLDLTDGNIDLAIRTGSVVDDSLVARKMGHIQEILMAREAVADSLNITLETLPTCPLLVNPASLRKGRLLLNSAHSAHEILPQQCIQISEFSVINSLLMSADYIALLPNYCKKSVYSAQPLVQLMPGFSAADWPVYLLYPYQSPMPMRLRKVSDFVFDLLVSQIAAVESA